MARTNLAQGYKALMALSANLDPPPSQFDPVKYYRVQLIEAVQLNGHWMRPSDDVVMTGALANSIIGSISGAKEVAGA